MSLVLNSLHYFFFPLKYIFLVNGLKPMRIGHEQGEMQLIAFTCRPRSAQPSVTKQGKAE
jgi:hypothetical protein